MIIKSSQRAGHRALAAHLVKTRDDDGEVQIATITNYRNLMSARTVDLALRDMEIMASISPLTKKDLYHVSMNPSQDLSEDQWETAWEIYETEYGLDEHPFVEVTHDKKGRLHKHRVYERVDTETERAIKLSFTKVRNEKVARTLEFEFGHQLTIGKHNRSVMRTLTEEGRSDITDWMEQGRAHEVVRPVAEDLFIQAGQERRTKIKKADVKDALLDAWSRTDNGRSFEAAIAEKGLLIAKGDKRDFVIVDCAGGTHSPRRMLGVKAKDLRDRWSDLHPNHLPSVGQIQMALKPQREAHIDRTDLDAAERTLTTERQKTDQMIATLERELARRAQVEREADPVRVRSSNRDGDGRLYADRSPAEVIDTRAWELDQRRIIEQMLHWQQIADADRERLKLQAASEQDITGWSLSNTTQQVLETYRGREASRERDRRIDAALSHQANEGASALGDYLTGLKQRLKKGRGYYRFADRWLTERLAKRGYSRMQARRALAKASPELMEESPARRVGWIRRLVNRVYNRYEQQQTLAQKKITGRATLSQKSNRTPVESRVEKFGKYSTFEMRYEILNDSEPRYRPFYDSDNKNIQIDPNHGEVGIAELDGNLVAALKQAARQSPNSLHKIQLAHKTRADKDADGQGGSWAWAKREYAKELSRIMEQKGDRAGYDPATDVEIAAKLRIAGFSWNAINNASVEQSPMVAALPSPEHQSKYLEMVVKPTLQAPYVRREKEAKRLEMERQGRPEEYRLKHMGLATEVSGEKQQDFRNHWGLSR